MRRIFIFPSQGRRVLTWGECVLTWGRRVPEAAEKSPEDASPPSEDALSHRRERVAQLAMTRRSLDSVRVSTGLWKCVHWPVETCILASGNTSTGQWTTAD